MIRNTVHLASYRGPAKKFHHQLTHNVICAVTASSYSHSELVINGIGYSSSERDGGVRAKEIDFNSPEWILTPIWWIQPATVFEFFRKTNGHGYDFWGLRLFLGIETEDEASKWWCSEWCATALGHLDTRVSPGFLHKQVEVDRWKYMRIAAERGIYHDR